MLISCQRDTCSSWRQLCTAQLNQQQHVQKYIYLFRCTLCFEHVLAFSTCVCRSTDVVRLRVCSARGKGCKDIQNKAYTSTDLYFRCAFFQVSETRLAAGWAASVSWELTVKPQRAQHQRNPNITLTNSQKLSRKRINLRPLYSACDQFTMQRFCIFCALFSQFSYADVFSVWTSSAAPVNSPSYQHPSQQHPTSTR